ncbi:MAG TPA: Dam-replacing domain protein, partial [Patescibacteria group bacterium]|nr:Dam-replacing domain protein [Patescibacteria group bacterium]
YVFENELSRLHPDNRHVKDKIRQQLQILRDKDYLEFIARGKYKLI